MQKSTLNDSTACHERPPLLQLATLGGGAGMYAVTRPLQNPERVAPTLVLTRLDFRLMDEIDACMCRRGMAGRYRHLVLAGASFGAVTEQFVVWSPTFWRQLDQAIKRHDAGIVMAIESCTCTSCTGKARRYVEEVETTPALRHAELRLLREAFAGKYPGLQIRLCRICGGELVSLE